MGGNISGFQAVSMGAWGEEEMLSKSIFPGRTPMNIIERNNGKFLYRPRNYFVRGIPVTTAMGSFALVRQWILNNSSKSKFAQFLISSCTLARMPSDFYCLLPVILLIVNYK